MVPCRGRWWGGDDGVLVERELFWSGPKFFPLSRCSLVPSDRSCASGKSSDRQCRRALLALNRIVQLGVFSVLSCGARPLS